MAPARIAKILDVVGHCHAEFNNSGPGFTVKKFGLHSSPEGFDHGLVIAITDRSEFTRAASAVRSIAQPTALLALGV